MSTTANLGLPLIEAAQAQKHVTHNEALRRLDAIVHLAVKERPRADPPASPAEGERYIVAEGAAGTWTGHDNEIAAWQDGAWAFYAPVVGWRAWIVVESTEVYWSGSAWEAALAGVASVNPAALVGVNTTADATNKLAVKSDATLFSHDDVTPGSGDHQMKINKSAAARTASLLFQSGYAGRAEIGLTGNDDFSFKVSPDGNAFKDAIIVDRMSGRARFPSGGVRNQLAADKTYYVSQVSGSDTNDGETSGTAFATIGKAVAVVVATDLGGRNVTIDVADGNYIESLRLLPLLGGSCTISGNTATPSSVTLTNVGSENCIACTGLAGQWRVEGMKLLGNRVGIEAEGGVIYFANMEFATTFIHMRANYAGLIRADGNYVISASAEEHMRAANAASIIMFGRTVTLAGTPAFSTSFARAQNAAFLRCDGGMTFVGAAAGQRYIAETFGAISTGGGGDSYLPGSIAGTVSTGGQYV